MLPMIGKRGGPGGKGSVGDGFARFLDMYRETTMATITVTKSVANSIVPGDDTLN